MADYLITGDNDLLIIKKYQNIPIITPIQFLNKIDHKGLGSPQN